MQNLRDKVRDRLRVGNCRFPATTHRRGFTLMELLVVIAIISVLAGLLMPALRRARIKAHEAKAKSMISSLQMALSMYETDYGVYPQSAATNGNQQNGNSYVPTAPRTLVAMLEAATGGGPYMSFKEDDIIEGSGRRVLLDPWGRAYIYVSQKYWDSGSSSWDDVNGGTTYGPFWPNNSDHSGNGYNIYSLGPDGETNGNETHTAAGNWDNSNLYNNSEDGYKDAVASTSPRYDDINSWE